MGGVSRKLEAQQVTPILSGSVDIVGNEWITIFIPSEDKTPVLLWFQPQNGALANAYFKIRSGNKILFNVLLGAYGSNGYESIIYPELIGYKNESLEVFGTNSAIKVNFSVGEI